MWCSIIIPAFQPTQILLKLTEEIHHLRPQQPIIIVDDGSTQSSSKHVFNTLRNVVLVKHDFNHGKGQALKSGFSHYLLDSNNDSPGIVTADADGQHTAKDIIKLCETLEADPSALHLGVRQFTGDIPLRSRIGNKLTCFIFRKVSKTEVSDTQTGLRGIPKALLQPLLTLTPTGYDFEMEMLLFAHRKKIPIRETPIITIYKENNKSSHFKPLKDSYRIYRILLTSRGELQE